jgi:alpha-glucosidase (family GH31 glycosyl hydrolase)
MSCKEGNLENCMKECTECSKPTMEALKSRNQQCMSVCGSRLSHGYAKTSPICECKPRTKIKPCIMDDDYERKKCFLENGYQYWDEECAVNNIHGAPYRHRTSRNNREEFTYPESKNVEDYMGGGGLQTNDDRYMGCDYTFPYINDIKLKYNTPFLSNIFDTFSKPTGGYIKYDVLNMSIALISMNPRQGGDDIAKFGILRTPAIDPNFKADKLMINSNIKVDFLTYENPNIFSKDDRLLESKLDDKYVAVSRKLFSYNNQGNTENVYRINFDFYKCQYGYIRIIDPDFIKDEHNYKIFGLGPISKENVNKNFSQDWLSWTKRRCNEGFGTQQGFGINGSHWPVMYIHRYNRRTKEKVTFLIFFDHFRKLEYFFEDLNETGEFKVRSREPEFRFYVIIEHTVLECRKKFMQIVGPPQPPVQKAMGMWVGGFGYTGWKDVEDTFMNLRKYEFPADGFIFDLYWYGHNFPNEDYYQLDETNYKDNFCYRKSNVRHYNKLGIYEWDERRFPDASKYINNTLYGKYNYGTTVMIEPYITADDKDFSYMFHNRMVATLDGGDGTFAQPDAVWYDWIGDHVAMPDFTNPETCNFWYTKKLSPITTDGTYSWWNDLTEPEVYNENALYMGIGQVNDKGEMMHEWHQAPDVLNFQQLLFTKGICENFNRDNRRYSVCLRSGTCGIQRYGAYMWPGDTYSKLEIMNSAYASAETLSLCGLDFTTDDAGGFSNKGDGEVNVPKEYYFDLYSLWFANSAATLFNLKPHKWFDNSFLQTSSPAVWGDVKSNLTNAVDRYLLSPYYYSWAMDISSLGEKQGEPWSATLYFKYEYLDYDDITDEYWKHNGDQKMIGPNLLFLLLTDFYDNEKTKKIYLPKTTIWYDIRHQIWLEGGKEHIINVNKNQLPLLVRNNSIVIKRFPVKNSALMNFNDVIDHYDVYVYSYDGLEAETFTLYEDDGYSMLKNQTRYYISFKNGTPSVKRDISKIFQQKKTFVFTLYSKNGVKKLEEINVSDELIEKFTRKFRSLGDGNIIYTVLGIIGIIAIIFLIFFLLRHFKKI